MTPSLTTVRVPTREVGRIAAEIRRAEIEHGPTATPQKIHLQPELVARASTRQA